MCWAIYPSYTKLHICWLLSNHSTHFGYGVRVINLVLSLRNA
ncbi:hypothetical protein YPPY36_2909 [Yersinia pestis PY-36]|nr:hypothetical protein YPPY05_2744 [Yersinia pestis PY-05]EIR87531.1 hypothetical protein YPPY36_2909 [Yersinia pestis PY-36]